MDQLKKQIHQTCLQQIAKRIQNLEKRIATINESKASETKSSVGDKFETGRAMLQMDEEKMLTQLQFNRATLGRLEQINLDEKSDQVKNGSLVKTEKGLYFVGIGLGKVMVDQTLCYCVSLQSPVGMALIGQKLGGKISINQMEMTILDIY
ncbi:MAG: hypothetical protein Sapg2KO_21890 [Saprospiraceae bacterium]